VIFKRKKKGTYMKLKEFKPQGFRITHLIPPGLWTAYRMESDKFWLLLSIKSGHIFCSFCENSDKQKIFSAEFSPPMVFAPSWFQGE